MAAMEILDTSWQMWAVFALITLAIILYATEWLALEYVSLSFIAASLLLFHLFPLEGQNQVQVIRDLLAGFADPALIAVLALLVVGQGLVRTGALESPVRMMTALGKNRPRTTILFTLLLVAALSAIVNNTPIVVVFIPVLAALAERFRHSAAAVMMPLSFAAILGGMTTLIGSSTNLLVAGAYARETGRQMDFFDFAVPGLFLASLGLFYVLFVMPFMLRARVSSQPPAPDGSGRHYILQWTIRRGGPLDGAEAVAGLFPQLRDMTIRMIRQGEQNELPPFDGIRLRAGDSIVVAATRAAILNALSNSPDIVERKDEEKTADPVMVEVVIPPASRMVGRTLSQTGFETLTGCRAVGVQRRSRMVRTELDQIRLEAGDVLLVYGDRRQVTGLRTSRDVLLLEWSSHDVPAVWRAWPARVIFFTVIALVITEALPIVTAALLGAVAMIAAGCLNFHQAARAVDRRVGFLVAAALAMGASLHLTGGAKYLADSLIAVMQGAPPAVILSALFAMIALLTNVISNNATAVLFTPIALSTAESLGVPPLPFVFAVIFAANCSFATPMGYQTNLLVMGPGHYSFSDFLKTGVPLIIIIWLGFSLFAPVYYGF